MVFGFHDIWVLREEQWQEGKGFAAERPGCPATLRICMLHRALHFVKHVRLHHDHIYGDPPKNGGKFCMFLADGKLRVPPH